MAAHDRPAPLDITSLANPRVKWLQGLRKRRTRDAERVTILEGHDELILALDAGVRPQTLFVCPALVSDDARLATVDRLQALGAEVFTLGRAAFERVAYRESPDGWLAVVPQPARALSEISLGRNPLILACESIEKPGNLGAMVRTAEAAGVDAVIAASPVSDWGNPNVIRASKATVFAVQVANASTADVAAWLHAHGVTTVAASPEAGSLITDLDLTGPIAIVVGAEHEGVSSRWLRHADQTAKIPMFGHVNSLNVATSAAIAVYEAVRQRGLR